MNFNFADCRVRAWGFVCIDCSSPPTARVLVDGMCDQCYVAAVLRMKF